MKVLDIALVGIAGYGQVYLSALLSASPEHGINLIAGVDPRPENSRYYEQTVQAGVPLFNSVEEMYAAGLRPDLVIIASPLHLHADQAELAMSRGSHVLCEKPLAATPEDAARMIAARDRFDRILSVGFQWAFAPGIKALKDDVRGCCYGRPTTFRTKVYWPRDRTYYARNSWAGRIYTADGRPVFDSPVNNACAHHVHNMLHILGNACDTADWPASVSAELYRAHPIENYDTAVLRCKTVNGVELLAAVSHATERMLEPCFEYRFERGVVTCDASTNHQLIGTDANGHQINYGPQPTGHDIDKLWDTLTSIRTGQPPACGAEAAAAHVALTAAAGQSSSVTDFGEAYVTASPSAVFVPGLDSVLDRCYNSGRLPSELGVPWAIPSRMVRVPEFASPAIVSEDLVLG